MSTTEEIEPYVPLNMDSIGGFDGRIWWKYRYHNYQGPYPWEMYATGNDALAAYIYAVNHLTKLRKAADVRRAQRKKEEEGAN